MIDFNDKYFEDPNDFLKRKWERKCVRDITLFRDSFRNYMGGESSIKDWLSRKVDEDNWPKEFNDANGVNLWYDFFDWNTRLYQQQIDRRNQQKENSLIELGTTNRISIEMPGKNTPWSKYYEKIKNLKISEEDLLNIEISSKIIAESLISVKTKPYKGLVIGSVQAGKTLSMLGVAAFAGSPTPDRSIVDTIIILTSNVTSLKKQTSNRIIRDIIGDGYGNFIEVDKPWDVNRKYDSFGIGDRPHQSKFITCVLKETTNLENLYTWLSSNKQFLRERKILIIDDEADWGSQDGSKSLEDPRAPTSQFVCNLLDLNNLCKGTYYLQYTATPYANVLNEPKLYPSSFITVLENSKSYFGVQNMFGDEEYDLEDYDKLSYNQEDPEDDVTNGNIVRVIEDGEIETINKFNKGELSIERTIDRLKSIHNDKNGCALIKSICYFLCVDSAKRFLEIKKPCSMLVHTNIRIKQHEATYRLLNALLKNDQSYIFNQCKAVWLDEISNFTLSSFYKKFPEYPDRAINSYPSWEKIKDILASNLRSIHKFKINESGDGYNDIGIHLSIDNGKSDSGPITYPEDGQNFTAIVIGGLTLSRGLTLEGLCVSYFFRSSKQGDAIMQMARWFGYRQSYELFQRIWLSKSSFKQFRYLAQLEDKMRTSCKDYFNGGDPMKFGPKILNAVPRGFLIPTSRNKTKGAVQKASYSDIFTQILKFDSNLKKIQFNFELTIKFLKSCSNIRKVSNSPNDNRLGFIVRSVPTEIVANYINDFIIHPRNAYFNKSMLVEAFSKFSKVDIIIPSILEENSDRFLSEFPKFKYPLRSLIHINKDSDYYTFKSIVIQQSKDKALMLNEAGYFKLLNQVDGKKKIYEKDDVNNALKDRKEPALYIYIFNTPGSEKYFVGLGVFFPHDEDERALVTFDTSLLNSESFELDCE